MVPHVQLFIDKKLHMQHNLAVHQQKTAHATHVVHRQKVFRRQETAQASPRGSSEPFFLKQAF